MSEYYWTRHDDDIRTAIIGRELDRYNIDIAALSEMRISGESEFVEGAGG